MVEEGQSQRAGLKKLRHLALEESLEASETVAERRVVVVLVVVDFCSGLLFKSRELRLLVMRLVRIEMRTYSTKPKWH